MVIIHGNRCAIELNILLHRQGYRLRISQAGVEIDGPFHSQVTGQSGSRKRILGRNHRSTFNGNDITYAAILRQLAGEVAPSFNIHHFVHQVHGRQVDLHFLCTRRVPSHRPIPTSLRGFD